MGVIPQVGRDPGAEQGGEGRDFKKEVAGGEGVMAWNLLSRPGWLAGWLKGHRDNAVSTPPPNTEIISVCHHTWHFFFIFSPFIEINFFFSHNIS